MASAGRSYGQEKVIGSEVTSMSESQTLGRKLSELIFGNWPLSEERTEPSSALMPEPDNDQFLHTLAHRVRDALHENPGLKADVVDTLAAFYRRQANAGDARALADLGDLLSWEDDLDGARAAYQAAGDAGYSDALVDLANLLNLNGDPEGAQAKLRQAIAVGNPNVTPRALVELGQILQRYDLAAAQATLQQAIETRHPDWAPAAMWHLGCLYEERGDSENARAAWQLAINFGNPAWAGEASFALACMLEEHGNIVGAKAEYRRLVESGHDHWSGPALETLLDLLHKEGDLAGVQAVHRIAVETGNYNAPYALVVLGQMLDQRGDTEGAWAAFQEAVDSGYADVDDIPELKSSPTELNSNAVSADMPTQFDLNDIVRVGMEVLDRGLPELPEVLSYNMTIPVAYWTAERCAVVLFLMYHHDGRRNIPLVMPLIYSRGERGWTWAEQSHLHGAGFYHDPIARPDDWCDMDDLPMRGGASFQTQPLAHGYPAAIEFGRASPAIKYIRVVQDGHKDQRPLQSHFGAWIVCTEQISPVRVEGLDDSGRVLASL